MLIDCGVLARDKRLHDRHRRAHPRHRPGRQAADKARLDVVVATHEHKDHLSGFNQAREVFNDDFDFGAVWLGWTENLTKPEIKKIKEAQEEGDRQAASGARQPAGGGCGRTRSTASPRCSTSARTTTPPAAGKIAEALEYLKLRGKDAGDLQYLEPGDEPVRARRRRGRPRLRARPAARSASCSRGARSREQMKNDGRDLSPVAHRRRRHRGAERRAVAWLARHRRATATTRSPRSIALRRACRSSNPGAPRRTPTSRASSRSSTQTYDDPTAGVAADRPRLAQRVRPARARPRQRHQQHQPRARVRVRQDARGAALRRRRAGRQLAVVGERRVQGAGPREAAAARTTCSAAPSSTRSATTAATTPRSRRAGSS